MNYRRVGQGIAEQIGLAAPRLFTSPAGLTGGRIVMAGDPTARRFTGWLAKLFKLRDGGSCREPYCAAPIRHLDHITSYRDGPTTQANGRGVCERHNQTREMPGWTVELLTDHPYTVATTTPTRHTYLSRAPNPPREPGEEIDLGCASALGRRQ